MLGSSLLMQLGFVFVKLPVPLLSKTGLHLWVVMIFDSVIAKTLYSLLANMSGYHLTKMFLFVI